MTLHIYTQPFQPATRWIDHHFDPPMTFSGSPYRLVWCRCCEVRRQARNCVVQVYYDGVAYWCAEGKGCKNPKVLAAKARREWRNRSAGQRRRWGRG